MKISITCGLSNQAATDFIKPIASNKEVNQILCFRKSSEVKTSKVTNYVVGKNYSRFLSNILLLFSFFKRQVEKLLQS